MKLCFENFTFECRNAIEIPYYVFKLSKAFLVQFSNVVSI